KSCLGTGGHERELDIHEIGTLFGARHLRKDTLEHQRIVTLDELDAVVGALITTHEHLLPNTSTSAAKLFRLVLLEHIDKLRLLAISFARIDRTCVDRHAIHE